MKTSELIERFQKKAMAGMAARAHPSPATPRPAIVVQPGRHNFWLRAPMDLVFFFEPQWFELTRANPCSPCARSAKVRKTGGPESPPNLLPVLMHISATYNKFTEVFITAVLVLNAYLAIKLVLPFRVFPLQPRNLIVNKCQNLPGPAPGFGSKSEQLAIPSPNKLTPASAHVVRYSRENC